MTDSNLTEIIGIVDRSGSMEGLIAETVGGYNNFLEEQKKGEGRALITLVQFDDQYQIDYAGVDVKKAPMLTELDISKIEKKAKRSKKLVPYMPRGMTALLDAVGKTIVAVGERLAALPEEKRPGQVIVLIITDGLENASQEYKVEQIREMIKHQKEKYSWTFIFMGGGNADFQGVQMGIDQANVASYSANSQGYGCMFGNVSAGVMRVRAHATRTGRSVDPDQSVLTEEEKQAQIVGDDDSGQVS